MLNTVLSLLALGGATAQALPDQLDVLRGVDRTPQIKLLIDLSGSMVYAPNSTSSPCDYYATSIGKTPGAALNRMEQLAAVLTGCTSSEDGILDRWASQIVFGIDGYEGSVLAAQAVSTPELVPFPGGGAPAFSSNKNTLETTVLNLPATTDPFAGTPMIPGLLKTAERFRDHYTDNNTEQCRENAIIVMTDGVGNGGVTSTFGWATGATGQPNPAAITVSDANTCYVAYDTRAPQGTVVPTCPATFAEPWGDSATGYLWGNGPTALDRHDLLPNVTGTQPIRTYTIGFNAPAEAQTLLEDMARFGGGQYYDASNYDQLAYAFDQAILQINANANASFTGATVQTDGIFSGNHVYQNSYQGSDQSGHWYGNIKKYCLIPESTTDQCLFRFNTAGDLVLSTQPLDLWSGSRSVFTRIGGAGEMLLRQMGADAARPPETVPASPLAGRDVVTWRHGTQAYIPVDYSLLGASDTFSRNLCENYALVNKLYGYTYDTAGCTISNVAPVAFDAWPLADTVNGGQVLLKYTDECESNTDECYLITVSNVGMIHIFDAFTGNETQAVVPPFFFRPNPVANNRLSDILEQPFLDFTRRFYFDGGVTLYHEDDNGNGYIDGTERADLIAGFGRGGKGYIKWDVADLGATNGKFTAADSPPRPLVVDQTTGFQHLKDTWAAPWTGSFETPGGAIRPVAIFPSGHQPELDAPLATFAQATTTSVRPSGDTEASPHTLGCADLGISPDVCSTPSLREICDANPGLIPAQYCGTRTTCQPCNDPDPAVCAGLGATPPFCYNWPGLGALPPTDLTAYGISQIYPLRVNVGPFTYQQGPTTGISYRITFSRLDLQPGDRLEILDGDGRFVQEFYGEWPAGTKSDWIRADAFRLNIVADLVDDAEAYGFTIGSIEVVRDVLPSSSLTDRPSVYVVDLDEWNGDLNGFSPIPAATDSRQAAGLLVRFTSDCDGTVKGINEVCIDQDTNSNTEDLESMICPLTAEPSVYTEGGLVRAIYLGDQCGQIWVFTLDRDATNWSARRLLSTNRLTGDDVVPGEDSKDYRKIFTKSDIVLSTCTGRRSVGVYFGTGNLQRPAAILNGALPGATVERNLQNPSVTRFGNMTASYEADVLGVVWDTPDVPDGGYTLADLSNATDVFDVDPTSAVAQRGFFIELLEDEKMLRRPLVFNSVAFFQTYQPTVATGECTDALGKSYSLAFDNCTAAPVRANAGAPSDRRTVLSQQSLIGGETTVVSTGKETLIIAGETDGSSSANLRDNLEDDPYRDAVRLFLWRVDVD